MRLNLTDTPALDSDFAALSDLDRAHALHEWRGRMVNEFVSARVFGQLLAQVLRAGLAPAVAEEVAEFAQEELRHGRHCASIVVALGGCAEAAMPALPDVPGHEEVSDLEALLRNLLSISCLSETVAVSLLSAGRDRMGDGPVREIVSEILADEVGHSRFGWRLVRELAGDLDLGARRRLSRYLVPCFGQLLERHVGGSAAHTSAAACSAGACHPQEDLEIVLATIDSVIVPGLEDCGLAARAAANEARFA